MAEVKIKNTSNSHITIPARGGNFSLQSGSSICLGGSPSSWQFVEEEILSSETTWRTMLESHHDFTPVVDSLRKEVASLISYFEEKGLTVENVDVRRKIVEVRLKDLKPHFFNKVVVPELNRYVERVQRRVTYRFKTFRKAPVRRVSVHLNLWLEDKRAEVVRFPS